MARRLPIGVQDFAGLRRDGFAYVDKTAYVYKMVDEGKYYFLARPRRFGKSLLVSTLRAYFEGRRELFSGLALEGLEGDGEGAWQPRPVFHLDFNGGDYAREGGLEAALDARLARWEGEWGAEGGAGTPLGDRFQALLAAAHDATGRRCVVLVDEYDKPLLEAVEDPALLGRNRAVFKAFFSVLKSADAHIRFALLTGVTKFSKVSIFSDLNNLRDISMERGYAGVCGVAADELEACFGVEVGALAEALGVGRAECMEQLAQMYDGYRFHPAGPHVYNPFSLVNAFAKGELGAYWFASGTPTFLVRRLRETGFDVRKLTDGMRDVLSALFASIPYTRGDDPFEAYFQAVIYLVFTLLGRFCACEMHAAEGRVDVIVAAERFVYVMELKRDGTAAEALAQVEERGYAAPFAADPRTLFRVGAAFDSEKRLLADWLAV